MHIDSKNSARYFKDTAFKDKMLLLQVLILFFGTLFKNFLLRSYVRSSNSFKPSFIDALPDLWPAVLLNIAVVALLFSFVFLFKRKGALIWSFSVSGITGILAFIDTMYYRPFNSLPSVSLLALVPTIAHTKSSPFSWMSIWDILYFADIIIVAGILIARLFRKKSTATASKNPPARRSFAHWLVVFSVSALCLAAIPVSSLFGLFRDTFKEVYTPPFATDSALYFTTLGFHAKDICDIAFSGSEPEGTLSPEETAQIENFYKWRADDKGTAAADPALPGSISGKNLIVLQVESLENSVIGTRIAGQEITPRLNALLGDSLHFTELYEQVKGGNSSDCDFMFMTSILPPAIGSVINDYSDNSFVSLPDILSENGYYSEYFNESGLYWSYEESIKKMMHFDDFFGNFESDESMNCYIPDRTKLSIVLDEMKTNEGYDDKFYAHIVLCSSHTPFDCSQLPEEYHLELPDSLYIEDIDGTRLSEVGGFIQLAHYVDAVIGEFIDNLDKEGLLENSVIVILGDHCGIHKYFPDQCDRLSQIPELSFLGENENGTSSLAFLIYDPSHDIAGRDVDMIGGQVDMLPTLLYLLGYDSGATYSKMGMMGRCLLNTSREFVILPSGALLSGFDRKSSDYNVAYHMYNTANLIIGSDYFASLK